MPPQGVGDAPVPAVTLATEHPERLRDFGPGNRVGDEGYLVWSMPLVSIGAAAGGPVPYPSPTVSCA